MKITDPEVIKNGEKDLIDAVQEDLDHGAVREILKERLTVAKLASKGGQIVVHGNQIAFRLDFEVNLSGSLLFDRDGNFIDDRPGEGRPAPEAAAGREDDSEGSPADNLVDMDDELPEEAFSFPDAEDPDGLPDHGQEPDHEFGPDLADDERPLEDAELSLEDDDDGLDLTAMDDDDSLLDDTLLMDDDDDLVMADVPEDMDGLQQTSEDGDPDNQDLDDDINDILKESREFWEQKKD